MSILNRPSDGLFNVLIALTRCLVSQGSMTRQKLLDLCIPKSLDPKQDMATKTLNRWIELGFFDSDEKDLVSISEPFKQSLSRKKYSLPELVRAISNRIFSEQNNANFWDSEENKSADFTRAQAWMLMQDVYAFSPSSYKEVEKAAAGQMIAKEYSLFTNDTRWSGFSSWSEFLGFGNTMFGHFSIDPTEAIRPLLKSILPPKSSLPISDFVDALSLKLPVLDDGSFRKLVEEKVNTSKWDAPKANELSTSLSRSLLRFDADETMGLENKADAKDKRILIGRGKAQLDTVSHVRAGSNLS